MIAHESKSSILFRHWIKANPRLTSSLEMKDTRGQNALLFSEVKQAQIDYGMAIKSDKGVMIRTQGIEGLPDYIYLRNEPAYVVIKFPKAFTIIDIETFAYEKKRSKKASLTCARAKELAIKVIDL